MIRQVLLFVGFGISLVGCDIQQSEYAESESDIVVLNENGEITERETPVYDEELTFAFIEDDLWELYEPACLSHGIDPEICRCIMAAVIDAAGINAAAWLASDMTLMEDQATTLLTHIGYEQATLAGDAFDAAQNGDCSSALSEPAETPEGAASSTSLSAVASEDAAIDNDSNE